MYSTQLKFTSISLIIFAFFVLPSGVEAANRYWVGGCSNSNWNCTSPITNWGSASNTQNNASVPGASDDVFFDGVGTGASNSTISAAITINSLDMTGYANTLTHNNAQLNIDSTGGLKFSAGMTYSRAGGASSIIGFTSTTGVTPITTAGKTMGSITFNGVGGTWQLQDSLTLTSSGGLITLTNGTFDTNNQAVSTGAFNSNNSNTRTVTLGSSAITLTDTGTVWNTSNSTNLTVTTNTAVVTITAAPAVFSSGVKNWDGLSLVFTSSLTGSFTLDSAGSTFKDVTFTGHNAKTNTFIVGSNFTAIGTLTINGNSSVNRVLVQTSTIGSSSTITAATVSVSNADFRDITGAGAGSWNLSAITGLSGDAGGNSGITFTTAQTQYWVGNTNNWSTAAAWGTSSGGSGGRVPLPQDDVVFDNGSFSGGQTTTIDMPRAGKSIDFSAYNEGQNPNLSAPSSWTLYGSLTLNPTIATTLSGIITFEGRGSFTLTSAGRSFLNTVNIAMVGGTLTLQDAFTSTGSFALTDGTFNANNFSVTATRFSISGTATRTLTMGNGSWTANSTAAVWDATVTTGLTFNTNNSNLIISNTTATAKTFSGGGLTYNEVIFSGDNITLSGSNIFNKFKVNNSNLPTGLILTSGTTQTVTTFSSDSSLGRITKIISSSAGSAATISQASGMVCAEYMSIKDSTATGGASWYAANSTDVSGNTGWSFTQCPSPNQNPRANFYSGPANETIRGGVKIRGGIRFR